MLSEKFQNLLQAELKPGERILWSGRPRPWRVVIAHRAIIPLIVGSAFVTFAVTATVNSYKKGELHNLNSSIITGGLAMLVFFSIGIVAASIPFWVWLKASRTLYAITNKRILIIQSKVFSNLDVLVHDFADLSNVSRRQRADGSGDILLYGNYEGALLYETTNFLGIPDVRAVEQILCKMRDKNLPRTT